MNSDSTTFNAEAVIFNAQLSLDEEIFRLLSNHLWMEEIEGRLFYPADSRSISLKLEKGDEPLQIRLVEGAFDYKAKVMVSVYSGITGNRPVFQGMVSIFGKTARKQDGEKFVFATELKSAEWSNETGLRIGPLKLPLRKVNNFVSGILKDRIATALDRKINSFFSTGVVPGDLAGVVFTHLNQSLPFSKAGFSTLSLQFGTPAGNQLPLKLFANLFACDSPPEIFRIEQVEMEVFSESLAKINISLLHLPALIPSIALDHFFGPIRLDFRKITPVDGGVEIHLDLSDGLTGKLDLFLPVTVEKKIIFEKIQIQKVKLKLTWKRILFMIMKRTIRNRMRSELKSKLDQLLFSSADQPLFHSPPFYDYRFAIEREGEAELSIDGENLSLKTGLSVNLIRNNKITGFLPQLTVE